MLRLSITITDELGTRRTVEHEQTSVSVGRDARCELVLADHTVSRRHARIGLAGGRCTIVDLGSTLGTRVNGTSIQQETEIGPRDLVQIGPFELAIATRNEHDPREAALIAALVERHEDGASLVYADWLEGQGDLQRAEFLRAEDGGRALAASVDEAWRRLVARAPIERCGLPTCPNDWRALVATDAPTRRRCTTCRREAHYCASVADAAHRVRELGVPVVIDLAVPRHAGDLDRAIAPPPPTANPPPPGWRARLDDDDVDG